ncbi:MAG: hypothetical protein Q9M91_08365 [Candidatus Dojkabacteria bacterium]|nr:hypothetical protein [Candidatus Dojkabacteria bacterium]MDQ7021787.1 hypothetical protein [Candidatus Dojkabacteria bacterium]
MNTNISAKRVLVYGDSVTWGRIAKKTERFDAQTRYTSVLQNELGNNFEVIEEGLKSRMAKGENPYSAYKNGYEQFIPIFSSHLPIDILVIFLGINDTNNKANKSSEQIVQDLESYIQLVSELSKDLSFSKSESIIFVSPHNIDSSKLKEGSMFSGASEKISKLPELIENMTSKHTLHHFKAGSFIKNTSEDGVHLGAKENVLLGKKLADFIKHNL